MKEVKSELNEKILDDLLNKVMPLDGIFNNMSTDIYGTYHIISMILRGIRGHLTVDWIFKNVESMTEDSYDRIQMTKVPPSDRFDMAKAVNRRTGEEVSFSVDVVDLSEYEFSEFLFEEDLNYYTDKADILGCTFNEAIGPNVMIVRINFDNKIICVLYDYVTTNVVILREDIENRRKLVKLSNEKVLSSLPQIVATLLHFYIFLSEDKEYTLDKETTLESADKLVDGCNNPEVKALFGELIGTCMQDKDNATLYIQNVLRMQSRSMGGKIPNPVDKDKLN